MGDDNTPQEREEIEREKDKMRAGIMRNYSERNLRRLMMRKKENRLVRRLRDVAA